VTSPGPGLPIERWATASQRLVKDAGSIVVQASDDIGKGTFDATQWVRSARQLTNLALTAGLELAPDVACLPGFGDLELSDFIRVEVPDSACQRELSVAKSFALDGAPSYCIPDQFVVFVPGILRVNAAWFRIGVNWPDLRSGTYRGRIRMAQILDGAASVDEMDVVVDL
jgi:hypothetical protein